MLHGNIDFKKLDETKISGANFTNGVRLMAQITNLHQRGLQTAVAEEG